MCPEIFKNHGTAGAHICEEELRLSTVPAVSVSSHHGTGTTSKPI